MQGKTSAALKDQPDKQHMTTQGKQLPFKPTQQMTWFVLFMLTAPQLLAHHRCLPAMGAEVFPLSFMVKTAHYLGVDRSMDLSSNLVSRLARRIHVHGYSCRLQNQTS